MDKLENHSENEIIELCKQGNDSAVNFVLEKYKPLVRKKARTLFLIGGDNDDLIQEGMIALYRAIKSFDSQAGLKFGSYAAVCIERQLYNVIKGANTLKNSPLNNYISLSSHLDNNDTISNSFTTLEDTLQPQNLSDPEDILIDKENVNNLEKIIDNVLSPMEKTVVKLYIDGCDYKRIALLLNKKPKAIDNALQRAKKKLEGNL